MFPFCQLLGYYTLFIQRYGVCFTALSPQRGSSFAVLISAIHLAVHLDKFLLSALVIFVFGGGGKLLNKLNLAAEECISMEAGDFKSGLP